MRTRKPDRYHDHLQREAVAEMLAWVNWRIGYMNGKADYSEAEFFESDRQEALAAVMDNRAEDALRLYVRIQARPENKGSGNVRASWRDVYRHVRKTRDAWLSKLVWAVCWR